MPSVIELRLCQSIHPDFKMAEPVSLSIGRGECVAIVGGNGSGKSKLVDMLLGGHPLCSGSRSYDFSPRENRMVSANIKYLEFRDITTGAEYYQQRWNQSDLGESPFVGELFEQACRKAEREFAGISVYDSFILRDETPEQKREREEREASDMLRAHAELSGIRDRLETIFPLQELQDKRIILLSSGESRKFQIARTLLANPRVFICDGPFVGLDAGARRDFNGFLSTLAADPDFTLVLVLSREDEIPDYVTHVIPVRDSCVLPKIEKKDYVPRQSTSGLEPSVREELMSLPDRPSTYGGENAIVLRNVCIRYGSRFILKDLNLTVRKGERWALKGVNGSGKTTLLSIINGDNPQSYANDIELFGRRRGSGESIWDIKRHIGFVSPEMHRFFLKDISVLDTVAGGLSDALGRFREHSQEEMDACRFWLHVFGIEHLAHKSFIRVSTGEQRLALLARAFVKDPELLILDEPLHALDSSNRARVRDIVDVFCRREGKTLLTVTHYDDELPSCIDHCLTLQRSESRP